MISTAHRRLAAGLFLALAVLLARADDEPEKQKEADWVDARWSQTDLGGFHSSVVALPNGSIAKGFSVRVGERGEAAVAYDTATLTWRGGWTGGFLKFNGARYGLLRSPEPAGAIQWLGPKTAAWGEANRRWRGWHVNGARVVLEYDVAGVAIQELPWLENALGVTAFTRTLALAPSPTPLTLILSDTTNTDWKLTTYAGLEVAMRTEGDGAQMVAVTGDPGGKLRVEHGTLTVELPASATPRHLKIILGLPAPPALTPFAAFVKASAPPADLAALAKPGARRWQPLTTRGQRGQGTEAYVVDTLTVPYDNPWKALFFTSGVDFLPNGDAAVCTIHGDVWLVSGIDDSLQKLTWRRFATGLFQPLGLRVRDGLVYVLGRDQITRLHDVDGDGEADFYENFFSGIDTSTGGHDYVTSLDTDAAGNFYYVDPRGAHRVAADGASAEPIGSGWRNPNGLGVSADGRLLLVAPQEGEWTPSSVICEARPGGWYGYGGPRVTPERPLGYEPPLCWIPHRVDNSSGSQLWVNSDRWGPLRDHFVHFSFGRCAEFLVLREVVDGVAQGAVALLPGKFLSGAMRGAFNPHDGQLYVVGSRGWQTSAVRDGCLQRVRYTGAAPLVPLEFHAHSNGLRLTFATPLERATAEDAGSYAVAHWNYRYAASYGSKDWSPAAPDREGHDELEVRSAKLSADGRTVFLEIPGLRPVMQWEVKYNLQTAAGRSFRSELYGTIHRLAPAWSMERQP